MVRPTFNVVREIGLALPDVVESTLHGAPSLKVRGKLIACVPIHKSAEPNCAMVRIDFERRAALLKASPEVYYITDHYADHPAVLVRLSCIKHNELHELLGLAWRFAASKKSLRSAGANASRTVKGPKSKRPERPPSGKPARRRSPHKA
jgi:hypothetical protein